MASRCQKNVIRCSNAGKKPVNARRKWYGRVWLKLRTVATTGFIPYLRTLLPAKLQYLGDKWKQVLEEPALVSRQKFLPLKHPWEREILTFGLKKLVWKKPDQALAVWARYEMDPHFTKSQRIDVARNFAIALASKDDSRAAKFLAMVPVELKDDLFLQWQITWYLRQQQWPRVIEVLNELPEETRKDDSWQYWLARAYEQSGKTEQSKQMLTALAATRGYYGFMAAAKLGLPPSLAHKPSTGDQRAVSGVSQK